MCILIIWWYSCLTFAHDFSVLFLPASVLFMSGEDWIAVVISNAGNFCVPLRRCPSHQTWALVLLTTHAKHSYWYLLPHLLWIICMNILGSPVIPYASSASNLWNKQHYKWSRWSAIFFFPISHSFYIRMHLSVDLLKVQDKIFKSEFSKL